MDKIIEAIRDMRQCRTANENLLELINIYVAAQVENAKEDHKAIIGVMDFENSALFGRKDFQIEKLEKSLASKDAEIAHFKSLWDMAVEANTAHQAENKRLRDGIQKVQMGALYEGYLLVDPDFLDSLLTPSEGEVKTDQRCCSNCLQWFDEVGNPEPILCPKCKHEFFPVPDTPQESPPTT